MRATRKERRVWLTQDLLQSPAWTTLPINARRVLDFLLAEHLRLGGLDNGMIKAPHRALNAHGVGTQYIKASIDDLETRGLVSVERGVAGSNMGSRTSRFRITWLPTRVVEGGGATLVPPTDDWRGYPA